MKKTRILIAAIICLCCFSGQASPAGGAALIDLAAQLEKDCSDHYIKTKNIKFVPLMPATVNRPKDMKDCTFAEYSFIILRPMLEAQDKQGLLKALGDARIWVKAQQELLAGLKARHKTAAASILGFIDDALAHKPVDLSQIIEPKPKQTEDQDPFGIAPVKDEPAKVQPGELQHLLTTLGKKLKSSKGKPSPDVEILCKEIKACLGRFEAIDDWLSLEFQWMGGDIESIIAYMQPYDNVYHLDVKDKKSQGFCDFLPGGFDLYARYTDLIEIQRQVADILTASSDDKRFLGKKCDYEGLYWAAPGVRPYVSGLYAKTDKATAALLDGCWQDAHSGAYLNHIFWKYQSDKCEPDKLAAVLARWNELYKPSGKPPAEARTAMLEVLNYRQGTVHSSHYASERFNPRIWTIADSLKGPGDPVDKVMEAMRLYSAITDEEAKKIFNMTKKARDCYTDATAQGVIMADLGRSGIYPFMQFGPGKTEDGKEISHLSHHAEVFYRVGDEIIFPFNAPWCVGDAKDKGFPPKTLSITSDFTYTRHVRTLASWVWAEMYSGETVWVQDVPYYGLKKETREIK